MGLQGIKTTFVATIVKEKDVVKVISTPGRVSTVAAAIEVGKSQLVFPQDVLPAKLGTDDLLDELGKCLGTALVFRRLAEWHALDVEISSHKRGSVFCKRLEVLELLLVLGGLECQMGIGNDNFTELWRNRQNGVHHEGAFRTFRACRLDLTRQGDFTRAALGVELSGNSLDLLAYVLGNAELTFLKAKYSNSIGWLLVEKLTDLSHNSASPLRGQVLISQGTNRETGHVLELVPVGSRRAIGFFSAVIPHEFLSQDVPSTQDKLELDTVTIELNLFDVHQMIRHASVVGGLSAAYTLDHGSEFLDCSHISYCCCFLFGLWTAVLKYMNSFPRSDDVIIFERALSPLLK